MDGINKLKEKIRELEAHIEKVEKVLEDQRNAACELGYSQQLEIDRLSVELKSEKQKHKHLLSYLILSSDIQ